MFRSFKKLIFPLLITLSALSVSLSAAFYSVSGLSKLFAGAAFAVIVMAASLEIAKLVIASLLYQYRKNLPKFFVNNLINSLKNYDLKIHKITTKYIQIHKKYIKIHKNT